MYICRKREYAKANRAKFYQPVNLINGYMRFFWIKNMRFFCSSNCVFLQFFANLKLKCQKKIFNVNLIMWKTDQDTL